MRYGTAVRRRGVDADGSEVSRYLRAEYTCRINQIGTGSVFWSPFYFARS